MEKNLFSVTLGSCIGFVGGITTDKVMEVIILSFIGGVLGGIGGTMWHFIKKNLPSFKNWLKSLLKSK